MVFERRVPIKSGLKTGRSRLPQKKYRRKKRNEKVERFVNNFWKVVAVIVAIVSLFIIINVIYLMYTLPDVTVISNTLPNETTKIYSADGVILADLHKEENRVVVPFSKISLTMKKAVVALEDARFYRHHGIDPIGIMRALVVDIIKHEKAQGASTITQQLARHLFLTKQKRLQRKIAEVLLAIKIERHYTKDEILGMYLNQVYWGNNCYGIESASMQYFNKHSEELTVAESAMLAGMLRAPEFYSPYRNLKDTLSRKDVVLKRIYKTHLINRAEYLEAMKEPLIISPRRKLKYKAPYVTSMIIDKLVGLYGEEAAYNSGLKVYTPINYKMQMAAEKAVDKAIEDGKAASLNYSQGALLAMDTNTGYVIAMVGGYDFLNNQFNKVTQARRQPGSAFKPFVYLTALSKQLSPGTIFNDSPVVFNTIMGPYAPTNYTLTYEGRLPMRAALEKSINVVAVKMVSMVRPESVIETARLFGITTPLMPVLSLALGTQEVSMTELTAAYGAFANGGTLFKPVFIKKIEDRNGVVLYREDIRSKKVFDSNLVYTLVDMMKGVVENGTGQAAKLPRPMAGKTGTTSDYKDAWFIGYIPQMVVSTWVGNDDGTPMRKVTGGMVPASIWKEFMKVALINVPQMEFPKPQGLIPVNICWTSGKRATAYCPVTSTEKYWPGHDPKDYCDIHGPDSSRENDPAAPVSLENKNGGWVKEFLEQ
ncbi:MAG: PBP1A family penicillin-binding protein [Candidatus Margulisbacteria bacterium]|nr:PBP1A family penicillin-binding protein [Candidatus Margulisiibacteriota bacterium]